MRNPANKQTDTRRWLQYPDFRGIISMNNLEKLIRAEKWLISVVVILQTTQGGKFWLREPYFELVCHSIQILRSFWKQCFFCRNTHFQIARCCHWLPNQLKITRARYAELLSNSTQWVLYTVILIFFLHSEQKQSHFGCWFKKFSLRP